MSWNVLALGSALGCMMAAGVAQTPQLRPERFSESLTDRVRTSGTLLAGVFLGDARDSFQPDAIHLPLRSVTGGLGICLRVVSRDGRYRGLAEYRLPGEVVPMPRLDFTSEYKPVLSRMAPGQIAIRATRSAVCSDITEGPVIPAIMGAAQTMPGSRRNLVALLNPGEAQVTARLLNAQREGLGGSTVRCSRFTEGVSIVFSHMCELPLPAQFAAAQIVLELVVTELADGRTARHFAIDLSGL